MDPRSRIRRNDSVWDDKSGRSRIGKAAVWDVEGRRTMQIVELAAKLQSVGFSEKQAKVYVAALFLGPSAVQKIAEQADVNRATAYVILDELMQMGLVSESTEGKKTVFVAEPPEAISRYLEAQKKALEIKKDELKSLMPSLAETSRATDSKDAPAVRFYKGQKGSEELTRYMMRNAKRGSEVYTLANYDVAVKNDPTILAKRPTQRLKKKISSKVIYYSKDNELTSSKKELRKTKKISKIITADINIYPDRASIITYKEPNPVGVLIESKEIAEALRVLFEEAFKK